MSNKAANTMMIPNTEDDIRPGIPIMVYLYNRDNNPDGILDIKHGKYYLIHKDGQRIQISKDSIITKNNMNPRL